MVAISVDPIATNLEVSKAEKLGFPLLSDPGGKIVKQFGLWDPGNKISWPGVYTVKNDKITWRYLSETYRKRPLTESLLQQF